MYAAGFLTLKQESESNGSVFCRSTDSKYLFLFDLFGIAEESVALSFNAEKHLGDLAGCAANLVCGLVMIQSIDDACDIFVHIRCLIIRLIKQLLRTIAEVGCDQLGEETLFIVLVKLGKTVCEKSEGGADKDALCSAFLHLLADVKHGTAGGDHVIDDDAVFSFNGSTEEFVCNNRVLAVDDL